MNLIEQAAAAKQASHDVRSLDENTRNAVLKDFANGLRTNQEKILEENEKDYIEAKENGMSEAMLDRLKLNEQRIEAMAAGIEDVIALPDPIHQIIEERTIACGIELKKVTVPIGVIGIIFESRPNVTADCAALCFKSGNACILKGGKESYRSCKAIIDVLKTAFQKHQVTENACVLAEKPSHEETEKLMACREYVDLLIPRGSKRLIRSVVDHAKVPVIETGAGVCHVYVDESADLDMGELIVINAKTSRPSVCNAMETLLVNEKIADTFVPRIVKALKEKNVIIYGDEKTQKLADVKAAEESSWSTEYDDLMMNLKVVKDVNEAIQHIETYGTHHSDSIVTENQEHVSLFMNQVDSACVYHNASTRWTDGFEFGLGAEIGISTQKLHARGPMGLKELTTYMYQLEGHGEIR